MEIVRLPLDALTVEGAVQTHSDAEIQRCVGILAEWGQILPVLYNPQLKRVISGEEVVEALRCLGGPDAWCILMPLDAISHGMVGLAARGPYGKRDNERVSQIVKQAYVAGRDVDLTGLPTPLIERALGIAEPRQRRSKPITCPKCGTEIVEHPHAHAA